MIEISLGVALALYSGVVLLGAAIIYIVTEFQVQRVYHVAIHQNVWRCIFCAYSFLQEDDADIAECPRCGSINTREEAQDRIVRGAAHYEAPAPAVPTHHDPEAEISRRNPSKGKGQKRGGRRRR